MCRTHRCGQAFSRKSTSAAGRRHNDATRQIPVLDAEPESVAAQDGLLRAGIQPDAQIRYRAADIIDAVEQQLGAQPLVHCIKGQLTEVCSSPTDHKVVCTLVHVDGMRRQLGARPLVHYVKVCSTRPSLGNSLNVKTTAEEAAALRAAAGAVSYGRPHRGVLA